MNLYCPNFQDMRLLFYWMWLIGKPLHFAIPFCYQNLQGWPFYCHRSQCCFLGLSSLGRPQAHYTKIKWSLFLCLYKEVCWQLSIINFCVLVKFIVIKFLSIMHWLIVVKMHTLMSSVFYLWASLLYKLMAADILLLHIFRLMILLCAQPQLMLRMICLWAIKQETLGRAWGKIPTCVVMSCCLSLIIKSYLLWEIVWTD